LALPAVLAFAATLSAGGSGFVWWHFVARDIGLGLASGLLCGLVASVLMPRAGVGAIHRAIPDHQKALYGLGIAFVTYSAAVLTVRGNGLIAVFVAAIILGIRRPDLRAHFAHGVEDIVEVVKLGVFAVFGSLLTLHGLLADGWAAIAIVAVTFLLARPIAVWLALAGTPFGEAAKAFMAWFGPRGVATIAFSLLILGRHFPAAPRIFNLAALTVFCSIILHGITATPGVKWIARREASDPTERESVGIVAA
jgi:NhaP-type Na+/H+ or K+/H+ antiporter